MRFLHIADVHLGCRRYNLEERTLDFFRVWHDVIVKHAIPNKLDFLLVAGDFFNSRKVDPQTMNHAIIGLRILKEAGIPVIVIEGNHDQHDAISNFSWLRSLSQWGFLKLLEPAHGPEGDIKLIPWNEAECAGSYIDIAGARIIGSHWYGMSANAAIPVLLSAIKDVHAPHLFNILMLHTDVEGQINRPIPALSIAKLKELREVVDYVALGHTHKRFELDGWAFNPGSLEACSVDEHREERGIYLIEVSGEQQVKIDYIRDFVQRPIQRVFFDVSGAVDPEAVHNGVMEKLQREVTSHDEAAQPETLKPIIEINLKGHLGFKNSLLDINRMRDEACAWAGALHVMVRNGSVPVEYAVAAGLDANTSRHERERRIIEDLIARDVRYRARALNMATVVIEAKRLVLSDESPEQILDLIKRKLEEQDERADETTVSTQITDASPAIIVVDQSEVTATATAIQAIERNATAAEL